ncbi:MAG TPA: DUF2306 domain-containing protein [Planctomycetaceae bacterium]|nr:DUF2306 domain-containing protein [Planctomycetaceae bacterium]
MQNTSVIIRRVLAAMVALLIVRVTVEVMRGYVSYYPPDFSSDFLHGREADFDRYRWAFYPHIVTGPFSLFAGLLLMSDRFRLQFPQGHRWLGRIHVANVLLILLPSGFVMGFDAAAGLSAVISFVLLTAVTAICTALGWRAAMQRRFVVHRRWMQRSYVLLCSAVVLRILGGIGTVLEVPWWWYDAAITWASWLLPLIVFELSVWWSQRRHRIGRTALATRATG